MKKLLITILGIVIFSLPSLKSYSLQPKGIIQMKINEKEITPASIITSLVSLQKEENESAIKIVYFKEVKPVVVLKRKNNKISPKKILKNISIIENVNIKLNGELFGSKNSQIYKGRCMISLKEPITKYLNMKIIRDFRNGKQSIYLVKEDLDKKTVIKFTEGEKNIQINGENISIDVAPYISKGNLMIPLRFICESVGYKIAYISNNVIVQI
jgi:hypothetical protein